MKVVYKKPKISHFNLKLYKGIKHMELIRIYPKTRIKSDISEIKVKISLKKYKTSKANDLYTMKLYFSPMLLKDLSWNKGSSVAVFKDDKNINNYFFKLSDDNRGFKIYNTKDVYYIQFTIDSVVDKYKELTTASFEIIDGGLKIIL